MTDDDTNRSKLLAITLVSYETKFCSSQFELQLISVNYLLKT